MYDLSVVIAYHLRVVYHLFPLKDSIEVEYQGLAVCSAKLTIMVRWDTIVLNFAVFVY